MRHEAERRQREDAVTWCERHGKQPMTKRILLIIILLIGTSTIWAYSDHRNRKVDSLENILRTQPPSDKKELVKIYSSLAWGYLEVDETKSTHYADLGIAVSEEMDLYLANNDFHRIKGMHHWGHSRYEEAIKEFGLSNEAIEKMRQSGEYDEKDVDDQQSALDGSLGNVYNTLGDGAKALDHYHKALTLFIKHDWKESQVIAYNNMAELYFCMGNLEHASEYYHKGDSVAQLINDPFFLYGARKGLAKVAKNQRNFKKAWELIMPVYEYSKTHTEEEGASLTDALTTMLDIAIEEGNWDKAAQLMAEWEALGKERYEGEPSYYAQKAMLCCNEGRWKEAETLALQAMNLDTDAVDEAKETFKLLSNIYIHLGDADLAHLYAEKADSVQTAWSNYAYQASLTEQETRFETEKKDLEITALSKQKMLMVIIVIVCAVVLVMLCVAIVLMRRSHKKQKALLAHKVALETETRERQTIAKDLHDGLGGLLSLLKLKIINKDYDGSIVLVDDSVREMRRVAHHIMPMELQKNGLVTSLSNFAVSIPEAQFHYFSTEEQDSGQKKRLPSDIELVLYRCAYELVNNAIKHASAKHIDIQLMTEHDQATLTVSDDGQGFNPSQTSDGMGLQNVRNRINQYEGRLDIISNPGLGTEINITLPITQNA